MLKIKGCENGGIGEELGFKNGYAIVSFDDRPARDLIDYLYFDSKEEFLITILDNKGRELQYEIEKDEDETLGLVFEDDGMEIKTCKNNCMFCFVDQMPMGMRHTLYVKDDDYRQSFLRGNFVTLTNLTDDDVDRIIEYKLSPLYVSVHTMNGELRKKMMNNRFADKIVGYLKAFSESEIVIHTQIVLVQGVNDGVELEYSARQLFALRPYVKTLAVVPCGITAHREGLTKIEDINEKYAYSVIRQVEKLNEEFGENFITLADEFYFKAKRPLPPFEFYGDFPQIENGVGMTSKFERELTEALEYKTYDKTFLLATGTSAEDFIRSSAKRVEKYCKSLKTHVIGVKNKFFGESVNCSGLLVGADVLEAVKDFDEQFDELVIPNNMLREFEEVFLDGMTVSELSESIAKPVRITDGTGEGFFLALTEDYK